MKYKDYLHSKLLQNKSNDKVFQKTYDTINQLTEEITGIEMRQAGLHPTMQQDKALETLFTDLANHNATIVGKHIIDLVNYTIHNFEK